MSQLSQEEFTLFAAPAVEVPSGFANVVRWVCAGEAEAWERSPLAVPVGNGMRGGDDWLAVAIPGTPQPAGTGALRLDFWVPNDTLVPREKVGWLYVKPGTPAINLRIVGPSLFSTGQS